MITQGWAAKWTYIAAVVGESRATFPACTRSHESRAYCASSYHDHSCGTFTGRRLGTRYKGSDKQVTLNKATSLHDVLYKRRKGSHTNYRKTGDAISVLFRVKQTK
jgi:hypothetical protein